jgi:hypothetical protein
VLLRVYTVFVDCVSGTVRFKQRLGKRRVVRRLQPCGEQWVLGAHILSSKGRVSCSDPSTFLFGSPKAAEYTNRKTIEYTVQSSTPNGTPSLRRRLGHDSKRGTLAKRDAVKVDLFVCVCTPEQPIFQTANLRAPLYALLRCQAQTRNENRCGSSSMLVFVLRNRQIDRHGCGLNKA